MSDPFELLGLTRTATLAEVRMARRRLAFDAHPDRGGDPESMRALNAAFDAAVAHVTGRRVLDGHPRAPAPGQRDSTASVPTDSSYRRPTAAEAASGSRQPGSRRRWQVERDIPSFVIEALPVEAFEALLIVTATIGELLVDEPPYALEAYLNEPEPCWCRLDIVPDAGSSTVSLTVAGIDGAAAPDPEVVRDVWIRELNSL